MNRTAVVMMCLIGLVALQAAGAELAGVKMPDNAVIDGKTVSLNGLGLRSKFFVKVYVAGLYVETRTKNENTVLSSDEIRQVRMVMTRDLDRGKIIEAVEEGFQKNNKANLPKLRARLDRFVSVIPDLREGDELVITYVPGKGTTLTSRSGATVTIEGKDFADALFSVWLGSHPVDEKLKRAMLGG